MASTKAQERASKKYYHSNKSYRDKKIAETQRKQKANRTKYNKYKRDYYEENEDYRKYKKRYAKEYRKREPIKSKARKYRKAYK